MKVFEMKQTAKLKYRERKSRRYIMYVVQLDETLIRLKE